MQNIHIVRASQAWPFVKEAERVGVPVERLAQEAGMPLDVFKGERYVLGELSAWRFIDRVAAYTRNDLFGYQTGVSLEYSATSGPGGMHLAGGSSLADSLARLISDARSESTASHYSLVPDGAGIWFRRYQPFKATMQSWQVEQYFLTFVIGIVRSFVGPDWLPPVIHVSSMTNPSRIPREWGPIDFKWGKQATRLFIPAGIIGDTSLVQDTTPAAEPLTLFDLIDTQVRLGRPGIEAAARELGVSASTIKRRLRESGTSYRRATEASRTGAAKSLLTKTDQPIATIAATLGYGYLPNFTRAFVRATGSAPSVYRNRGRTS